jgi:hypothetical protein
MRSSIELICTKLILYTVPVGAGGAEEVVHSAADPPQQDDAKEQSSYLKTTRREESNSSSILPAGKFGFIFNSKLWAAVKKP